MESIRIVPSTVDRQVNDVHVIKRRIICIISHHVVTKICIHSQGRDAEFFLSTFLSRQNVVS